ncbi:hypothetical protein N431DRAFT_458800 [Stipitochalara longipes BDJ]|nr:hypothetical protein N431DRAFT_458800 [Stipitochalara longipes BDJ]
MSRTQTELPPYGKLESYQKAFGPHLYVGDRIVDLGTLLSAVYAAPALCPLYVHIFCDVLEIPLKEKQSFDLVFPESLRSIEIFARCFLPPRSQQNSSAVSKLNFKTSKGAVTVTLYAEVVPPAMDIHSSSGPFLLISDLSHESLPLEYPLLDEHAFVPSSDGVGVKLKFDEAGYILGSATSIDDVNPGMLDMSMDDLAEVDEVQRPNYLGHLLETLFIEAAGKITEVASRTAVRSQFAFISKCCRTALSFSELCLQSREMRQRLQTPDDSILWAPTVTSKSLEEVLRYRVQVATLLRADQQIQTIEDKIQKVQEQLQQVQRNIIDNQNDLKAKIGEVGAIMVTNIAFSNENFVAKAEDAKVDLKKAETSMWSIAGDFYKMQSELQTASYSFRADIKKWQEEEERKAVIDCAISVFEVVVAVGAACETGGATAPAVAGAGKKVVESAEKAAKAGEKAVVTWKKIKESYEKIKKITEQVQKVQTAINKFNKAGKTSGNAQKDLTNTILPNLDAGVDFTKLKLEWEENQVTMTAVFENLDADFKSMASYKTWKACTQILALRAYAQISASKEYQDRFIKWSRAVRDAERVQVHQKDLKIIAQKLKDQAELDRQAKVDPKDPFSAERKQLRLKGLITNIGQRSVKRWLFLDFHKYSLAIMYITARSKFPVSLSAARDLQDFLSDISKVLASMNDNHRFLSSLSYPIVFKASEGVVTTFGWSDTILATKSLPFDLPRDPKYYTGHIQLKLNTVEVYIEGLKPKAASESPSILINVSIGPRTTIYDDTDYATFYIAPQTRTFDRRTAPDGSTLPDTGSHPKGINQKADFRSDGVSIAPSLFSSGMINVLNPEDWEWEGVKDIRFEFYCEADQLYQTTRSGDNPGCDIYNQ